MTNKKKEIYKPKPMTEAKRNIIQSLMQEYDIKTMDDIEYALKDSLSGTIQDMLETEMNEHLGYKKYERTGDSNYRNGSKTKSVRSKYGESLKSLKTERVHFIQLLLQNVKKIFLV